MAPERVATVPMQAHPAQDIHVVLKPISHPQLGEIPIDDLFPVGRTEPPFASFPPEVVDALSRRHARIFCEGGKAYVADLESKNGTTVNGVRIREKPSPLRHGDELCFGGELCYRVQLEPGKDKPAATRVVGIVLTPERGDLGLQPLSIERFPFLVGKGDETFSRYKDDYPHQVNYLSRRHAHIFLKGGLPYIEDLGSTNGTFVAGNRLDEHAVPLAEGDLLAFGGHHFVYRVSLRKEAAFDPTVTRVEFQGGGQSAVDTEKTTFVAAADSFLDIFCVEHAPRPEDEANPEGVKPAGEAGKEAGRSRMAVFVSELAEAFAGSEHRGLKRYAWWGAGAIALVALLLVGVYFWGVAEREIKDQLADGEYARAAVAADQYLERHPDNAEVQALGTEAVLKAHVPAWTSQLKARNFDGAAATLAGMKPFAVHNPEVQALLGEIEWIGGLEQFFVSRGGGEAPIRIYSDEEKIKNLLKPWDEDPLGHQQAFDRISSYVPEFKDIYAEALSHLRKLQSDDSVYLAAIERLKTAIATELNRNRPEALEAVLKEYAEKYPRLAGMDSVHEDLQRYRELEGELQARRLDRIAALLAKDGFSTPPFQARVRAMAANGQLPPPDIVGRYEAVSKAWREGNAQQTFAGLQQMTGGPWKETAERELARRKNVAEQFAELQKVRNSDGYDQRLLSFYGILDPEEDLYFLRAIEADLGAHRDKALKHAQELLNRAQALWTRYRENGAIAEEQRAETAISPKFRNQARLLGDAQTSARQGLRIYALLKADAPAQWSKVQEEINGEAEQQRRSLLELRAVLEPNLLKTKLALIGGRDGEQGKSP